MERMNDKQLAEAALDEFRAVMGSVTWAESVRGDTDADEFQRRFSPYHVLELLANAQKQERMVEKLCDYTARMTTEKRELLWLEDPLEMENAAWWRAWAEQEAGDDT